MLKFQELMRVTFDVKVSGPLLEGKYAAIYDREMLRATQDSVRLVSRYVRANASAGATRQLKRGIRGKTISTFHGLIHVEGPAAKYAIFSERGRRAGRWPPVKPIQQWVRVILRPPIKNLDSVTFLVRRKIGEQGTRGAQFFRSTVRNSEQAVHRIFQRAVQRFVRAISR